MRVALPNRRPFASRTLSALLLGAAVGATALPALASTESTGANYFGTDAGDPADGGGFPVSATTTSFGAAAGDLSAGDNNSYFGYHAGMSNVSGFGNSFFGYYAGRLATGPVNSFFGAFAGAATTDGSQNAFFGNSAGTSNTGGTANVLLGHWAGVFNVDGNYNTMAGAFAGQNNTHGSGNSYFGYFAGLGSTTGTYNTFIGLNAATQNSTGSYNTTLGYLSGGSLSTESTDTAIGAYSDIGVGAFNATAIGYQALVTQPNSLVLGSIANQNGATVSARVGIGTPAPSTQLHVKGDSAGASANNRTAIRVENTAATIAARTMLQLVNNGNSIITFTDTSVNQAWSFQNQGNAFLFQRNGNVPFKVTDTGQIFARNGAAANHFILNSNGNLTISGVLTQGSDVNSKKDIVALDGGDVLAKLDALPVSAWTYKTDESSARHAGPMAQDFHAVFGLGDDETRLAPGDEAGVALAAVKELSARLAHVQVENDALRAQVATANDKLEGMAQRMERVEQLTAAASGGRTVAMSRE
jgi:hypothetical protein